MDPIHLQIRYGNDHTHVERLQKQQWREEEELDNLSTQYKGGVYKAIQERNKKLAEVLFLCFLPTFLFVDKAWRQKRAS